MFNYIQIKNKLTLINLNEFINKCAIEYPNEIDRLVEKFDYLYFNSLILEAYHKYPSLNNYNGIKLTLAPE